jgi:hypothetical protein
MKQFRKGAPFPMSAMEKLKEEIRSVLLVTLYFAIWMGVLLIIKKLILAEYDIEFKGLTAALVGALVLAKVVLILEHVSLGAWLKNRPVIMEVILRTLFYTLGVFVVLVLEKSFEGRHDYGGFIPAVIGLFQTVKGSHVWVNVICISGALLVYNIFSALKQILGEGALLRALLSPLPKES